jgi:hypothetical protein
MSNPLQKGNSLKGNFDKFTGSNDVSVWKYNMESLLRGLEVYDFAAGKIKQPRV